MAKANFDYIPIHSREELEADLKGYHLGKKFIDENGNIFTVRFNKEKRKLEVVRVVLKSQANEVTKGNTITNPRNELIKKTFLNPKETIDNILKEYQDKPTLPKNSKTPYEEYEDEIEGEVHSTFFHIDDNTNKVQTEVERELKSLKESIPENYIPDLLEEKEIYKEIISDLDRSNTRIKNCLANLQGINIFSTLDGTLANRNAINNFEKVFNYEVYEITERLKRKYKELTLYPREFNHYLSSLPTGKVKFLESVPQEKKMAYIIRWEIFELLIKNINSLRKMLFDLLSILNSKDDSDLKLLTGSQKSSFEDSKKTALFCLQLVTSLEKRLSSWKKQMVD